MMKSLKRRSRRDRFFSAKHSLTIRWAFWSALPIPSGCFVKISSGPGAGSAVELTIWVRLAWIFRQLKALTPLPMRLRLLSKPQSVLGCRVRFSIARTKISIWLLTPCIPFLTAATLKIVARKLVGRITAILPLFVRIISRSIRQPGGCSARL